MEKKGLKIIQRRIDILENRLSSINVDLWNSEVYTYHQYCLHAYLLLGEYSNQYFLLSQELQRQKEDWELTHPPEKPFPDPGVAWGNNIIDKSWNVLETSYHVAVEHLPVNEILRLCLSYEYCAFLWKYGEEYEDAKQLAHKVYDDASVLSFELDTQQLQILQKIRADLLLAKRPPALFQTYHEREKAKNNNGSVAAEDEENNPDNSNSLTSDQRHNASFRITRKKTVKFAELDKLRDARQLSQSVHHKQHEIVAAIKKSLSPAIAQPIVFENVPSSSIILKTVDKIFRAYIRGNALPGQLTSGNTVDLAGHTLTFGNFLLNGPYMSWKGFLQFLMDFNIVQLPSKQSKIGQKFWRTMSSYHIMPDSAAANTGDASMMANINAVEPVVSLKEAAFIFIQCTGAAFPAFYSRRASQRNNKNNDNGNIDDNGNNNNTITPEQMEADSWRLVMTWAENDGDSEWEIDVGTNFPQFVDCLGKLGIVAYSKAHFAAILPTITEKIEHFLSAFLGLTDQRKWFSKVQKKLKMASSAIKDVAERAKNVTSNSNNNTTTTSTNNFSSNKKNLA